MIKRLLKSIRQKPKHSRDSIAFSLAALFSGLILIGWIYNTPVRHMAIEERYKDTDKKNTPSSFTSFFENFVDQVASIKNSFDIEEQKPLSETTVDEDIIIKIDPMVVEARASSSDKYTWPTREKEFNESTSIQSSPRLTPETGREVRIITIDKSTTTAN